MDNQPASGNRDMIDRAAPVFGLMALLLGIASLLPYFYLGMPFAAVVAFFGCCLSSVAIVKRQFVLGGLGLLLCLSAVGTAMLQPPPTAKLVYMTTPVYQGNGRMPPNPPAASKPPASL